MPNKAHIGPGDYSYHDPSSLYSLADSLRESDVPIHYDTLPSQRGESTCKLPGVCMMSLMDRNTLNSLKERKISAFTLSIRQN